MGTHFKTSCYYETQLSGVPLLFDMAWRRFVIFCVVLSFQGAIYCDVGAKFTAEEQGKIVVARHLLSIKPDDPLRWVRNESYWKTVFSAQKKSDLFDEFWPRLQNTLADIPMVQSRVPNSTYMVRAILGALRPMPLVPLTDLALSHRQKIRDFAAGPLSRLSKTSHNPEAELSDAIADVAFESARVFRSSLILEAFQEFTDGIPNFRFEGKEIDVLDNTERLNELLHLYGLHLVIRPEALDEGMVILSAYVIEKRFEMTVANETLSMALVNPVFEPEPYSALGHAEEGGVMLLFQNRINRHSEDMMSFLNGKASALLISEMSDGNTLSVGGLTSQEATLLEEAVRPQILKTTQVELDGATLSHKTMLSVARHEGYHKVLEPQLQKARRNGKISWEAMAEKSEEGAYLYQLESSDPDLVALELFMITVTALQSHTDFDANRNGARNALSALQIQLPQVEFWSQTHDPIPSGLMSIFVWPGDQITAAAAKARREFEMSL